MLWMFKKMLNDEAQQQVWKTEESETTSETVTETVKTPLPYTPQMRIMRFQHSVMAALEKAGEDNDLTWQEMTGAIVRQWLRDRSYLPEAASDSPLPEREVA